ncbi:MAG: hypothetical protein NC102_06245 [Clostridium sp.]|nr:hypothetical protein [Clostridium sp.]
MKNEVIAFLERFDIEHATPDSQMGFILAEMDDDEAASNFGKCMVRMNILNTTKKK